MDLCACAIGQMLKTKLPVNCFNSPWTDDLHYIVMNTVRLLCLCVLICYLSNANHFLTLRIYKYVGVTIK